MSVIVLIFVFIGLTRSSAVAFNIDDKSDLLTCGNRSEWFAVNLETIGVVSSDMNSRTSAIQSSLESCMTFAVNYTSESSLELSVYLKGTSKDTGISILMFENEEVEPTLSLTVRSNGLNSCWQNISLLINNDVIGYITLLGFSERDDIVLVNSIRYIPNNSGSHKNLINEIVSASKSNIRDSVIRSIEGVRKSEYDVESLSNDKDANQVKSKYDVENLLLNRIIEPASVEKYDATAIEYDTKALIENIDTRNTNDVSGVHINDSEDTTNLFIKTDLDSISEENSSSVEDLPTESERVVWNPFLIALAVVIPAMILVITCFGFYHLGFRKGSKDIPVVNEEDIEVPRVIPRVRGVYPTAPSEMVRASIRSVD